MDAVKARRPFVRLAVAFAPVALLLLPDVFSLSGETLARPRSHLLPPPPP